MNCLDVHAPAVQALAALLTLMVTAVLAWISYRYMTATDAALKLNREQFEREWTPGIHLRPVGGLVVPGLEFSNLGRMAVVVTTLLLQLPDASPRVFTAHLPRPFPLLPGGRDSLPVSGFINESTAALGLTTTGTLRLLLKANYTTLGRERETEWLNFSAEVSNGAMVGLESSPK
jgi:hypothetical protein